MNGQLNGSVQDSGEESTADDTIGLYKVRQLLNTHCCVNIVYPVSLASGSGPKAKVLYPATPLRIQICSGTP